jgi:hypothetical protein
MFAFVWPLGSTDAVSGATIGSPKHHCVNMSTVDGFYVSYAFTLIMKGNPEQWDKGPV